MNKKSNDLQWVALTEEAGYWAKKLECGHLVKEDFEYPCPFCIYDKKMEKAATRIANKKSRSAK